MPRPKKRRRLTPAEKKVEAELRRVLEEVFAATTLDVIRSGMHRMVDLYVRRLGLAMGLPHEEKK